jgi:hypothetical protein
MPRPLQRLWVLAGLLALALGCAPPTPTTSPARPTLPAEQKGSQPKPPSPDPG